MIFHLKNFILSRNGRILLFCVAITFSAYQLHKSRKANSDETLTSKLPPPTKPWGIDAETSNDMLQTERRNPGFVPFTPPSPPPQPQKQKLASKPKPELKSKAAPSEEPFFVEPLFKEQRPLVEQSLQEKKAKTYQLPQLEAGALIPCRLATAVNTIEDNTPVLAVTTAPIIRDGITLFTAGSRIIGKTSKDSQNRVFFSTDWTIITPVHSPQQLSATALERSIDLYSNTPTWQDGQPGIPGFIHQQTEEQKSQLISKLAVSLARLGIRVRLRG